MTRIFRSDNWFNYDDRDKENRETRIRKEKEEGYTGICMGASALWCLNAMRGNFRFNPHKQLKDLNQARKWAKHYVEVIPGIVPCRDLPVYNRIVSERLRILLKDVKIKGTKVHLPAGRSDRLINHIKENSGIYLIIGGTHVMGVSSVMDNYYFYDNMTGLYECSEANLASEIKRIRTPAEWANHATVEPRVFGKNNSNGYGWHGVKCEYMFGSYYY